MANENNDVFFLKYATGCMEINISVFFPCTIQQERILYPLIRQYGEACEVTKIRNFLSWLIEEKKDEIQIIQNQLTGYREGCSRYRQLSTEIRNAERIIKRATRNLTNLDQKRRKSA